MLVVEFYLRQQFDGVLNHMLRYWEVALMDLFIIQETVKAFAIFASLGIVYSVLSILFSGG